MHHCIHVARSQRSLWNSVSVTFSDIFCISRDKLVVTSGGNRSTRRKAPPTLEPQVTGNFLTSPWWDSNTDRGLPTGILGMDEIRKYINLSNPFSFSVVMEIVGPKNRVFCANILMCIWATGYLIVAGIGYLFRDRLSVQLALSLPCAVLVMYPW